MTTTSNPIGLFDSGVGGITVMQEIIRLLPCETLIYFGDTARIPYGNKGNRTIERYSIENTIALLEFNIKLLIVACNTASALALPKLRNLFKIPILGVIEPGAEKAATTTRTNRIAVLGTKGTIQSGAYQSALQRLIPQAAIIPIACPLLVHLVEERWLDHEATRTIVREYLKPIQKEEVDTLLLGCTHYPFLKELFQDEIGREVAIIDSASACANAAALLLKQQALLSPASKGSHHYYSSDDPQKFGLLIEELFHCLLPSVNLLVPGQSHIGEKAE